MDFQKRFKEISSKWFLSEPLLFQSICTHTIIPNQSLTVPMRTGKMRIEYSPLLLEKLNPEQIEEYLKIEAFMSDSTGTFSLKASG